MYKYFVIYDEYEWPTIGSEDGDYWRERNCRGFLDFGEAFSFHYELMRKSAKNKGSFRNIYLVESRNFSES